MRSRLIEPSTVWFLSQDTTQSKQNTMADECKMATEILLPKADLQNPDCLRDGVQALAQELIELDVNQHLQAERY